MSVAPVILAAGASRRLGEPKALANLGGRSVLRRLVEVVEGLSSAPLIITGHHHAEIEAHAARWVPGAEVAYTRSGARADLGRGAGRARRPEADLMICPADVPLSASIVESLQRREAPGRRPRLLAPSVEVHPGQGQFGHPIIMGAGWRPRRRGCLGRPCGACETAPTRC